jgi:acyl-CoA oxidase
MHQDQIGAYDGGAITLLTIQYNLAAGTLAPHALERPELMPLLNKMMNFDVK